MSSELEFVEDRCRRLLLLQSVVDQGGIRSTTKCTSKNQVLATRLLHMLSSHRRHTRKTKPNEKKEKEKQKNSLRRREEEETFRKRKRASAVSTTAATTAATERSRIIRRRINTKTKQKRKKREKKRTRTKCKVLSSTEPSGSRSGSFSSEPKVIFSGRVGWVLERSSQLGRFSDRFFGAGYRWLFKRASN